MMARTEPAVSKERLRLSYRPARVRMLFVGESPPASGRFFYQADSGLYRAMRDAFARALPNVDKDDFLKQFQVLGCYLVDLCGKPVDRLNSKQRREACIHGEVRLARILKELSPGIVITVVRSIGPNVKRAELHAGWRGQHVELPYPGRWHRNRRTFLEELMPVLQENLLKEPQQVAKD
jgi:hypothetical protein